MPEIVCIGILVADFIASVVKKLPERGKLELVDNTSLFTGGCATNTAIALAKLGIDVEAMGMVGDDIFGEYIIRELRDNKVGIKGVKKNKNKETSTTIVMVDPDGERRFIHNTGANGELRLSDIDWDIIKKTRIIHVAGSFLLPAFDGEECAQFLKESKKLGITTTLDTAWDSQGKWMDLLEDSLPYIDYFLPSYEEAIMLSGKKDEEEICNYFLNNGVGTVGLKMGSKGCLIKNKENKIYCPPLKVKAIDTTGAGDSWVAGFLTGLYKGWSIEKIGRFANSVGASCVQSTGASTGIKSYEETLEMLVRGE